jgi:hypothetical protein
VRWSTPIGDYRTLDGRTLATSGLGRWHPEPPEGAFDYLEFHVDAITYVQAQPGSVGATDPPVGPSSGAS